MGSARAGRYSRVVTAALTGAFGAFTYTVSGRAQGGGGAEPGKFVEQAEQVRSVTASPRMPLSCA